MMMAQHHLAELEAAMLQSLKLDPTGGIIYELALKVVFGRPSSSPLSQHPETPSQVPETEPLSPSTEQLLREAERHTSEATQPSTTPRRPPEITLAGTRKPRPRKGTPGAAASPSRHTRSHG